MFVTIEDTLKYTQQEVTNDEIFMAQALIEAYIGRVEAQVDDATDKENLAKAVAYQAVYMKDNADTVFKQIDAQSITSFGSTINFKADGSSPFIASAAKFALRNLSWRGTRSVRVGKTLGRSSHYYNYDWTRDDN